MKITSKYFLLIQSENYLGLTSNTRRIYSVSNLQATIFTGWEDHLSFKFLTYMIHILRYLRALGAFYLRLVGTSLEIYQYLEPLLNDHRKLRQRLLGYN